MAGDAPSWIELFVPGRVCLFGEHSDWAGGYRRFNSNIVPGACIVSGTDHGIFCRVRSHPNKLVLRSVLEDGSIISKDVEMQREVLLAEAAKGEFFSYSCGVAAQIMTRYHVRGLCIENYKSTLPARKGLSSSAAVCVLVARGFNRVYDLKMTVRGEMEMAYYGEISTPSRCGRMDQCVAFGRKAVLMNFDGDLLNTKTLSVVGPMYLLLVDLGGDKDTTEILQGLAKAFPFPDSEIEKGVQVLLGQFNQDLTARAIRALEKGDAAELGRLMTEAQAAFDRYAIPACPSQLTSPLLHKLLENEALLPHIFGGKGVGSQGDGTAQLLCKSAEDSARVEELIAEIFPKMSCMSMTLGERKRVTTALIPAAGRSNGLFPMSKVLSSAMLPMIDSNGVTKPAVLALVEQAITAGIERVVIVVAEHELRDYKRLFQEPLTEQTAHTLSPQARRYADYILEVGTKITLVTQDTPDGFGHAVATAKEAVGVGPGEHFLLMLGDHLYLTEEEMAKKEADRKMQPSCVQQLLDAHDGGASLVGMSLGKLNQVRTTGVMCGEWQDDDKRRLSVSSIVEKPTLDFAKDNLSVSHVRGESPENIYPTVFGLYVLDGAVFEYLDDMIAANLRVNGSFQLTPCLERLRKERGVDALRIEGQRHDIGLDAGAFTSAFNAFSHQASAKL